MGGQWFYNPEIDCWSLVSYHQEEISISGALLKALCNRTGMTIREALTWISTRPRAPYSRAA